MNSALHVEWSSSLRCPNHDEPVEIIVDKGLGVGTPHIEIAGCCTPFVRLVERKLQSLLKAEVHTLTRPHLN
jgi:hypothetical protein